MDIDVSGADMIAAERERQKNVEGWTPEHDSGHTRGELKTVAALYAVYPQVWYEHRPGKAGHTFAQPWPATWAPEWDKRAYGTPLKNLVIAGALIAAEIDRVIRGAGEPARFMVEDELKRLGLG